MHDHLVMICFSLDNSPDRHHCVDRAEEMGGGDRQLPRPGYPENQDPTYARRLQSLEGPLQQTIGDGLVERGHGDTDGQIGWRPTGFQVFDDHRWVTSWAGSGRSGWGGCSDCSSKRWPSLLALVFRYRSFSGFGDIDSGIRSTIDRP